MCSTELAPAIVLETRGVGVVRAGVWILRNAGFVARYGTLTAIIGPNGAGKTTLLRALSGDAPDAGEVLVMGDSLYEAPERVLGRIGYVPVDSVLHDGLTVWQALELTGRARLPMLDEGTIKFRANALLEEFDLPAGDTRRDCMLATLSSGERKRVNICAELLADPPVLLLDEPTSNLDPDAERDLMQKLAARAHSTGQTIVVVTHTLNTVDCCDEVAFIENAHLRIQGSPAEALQGLLTHANLRPDDDMPAFYRWAAVFDFFKTRPAARLKACNTPARTAMGWRAERGHTTWWAQFRRLAARYLQLRMNDVRSMALLLSLGLLGGVFMFVLPPAVFVQPESAGDSSAAIMAARQAVFILALVVALIGLISSYTEVSREWRIYRHERAKGLSPLAYLISKGCWLSLGVGLVAPSLLLAWLWLVLGQPLPLVPVSPVVAGLLIWITLVATCLASIALGLALSALSAGSGRESLLLAVCVIYLVLFSGLIKNAALEIWVNALSTLSPSRWAFEGVGSSLGFYCWSARKELDEFNSTGHLLSVWIAQALFCCVAMFAAWCALRARDPWASASANLRRAVRSIAARLVVSLSFVLCLFWIVLAARAVSGEYHKLTFAGDPAFGGTGGVEYARIGNATDATDIQRLVGQLSQSWCESIPPDNHTAPRQD